MILFSKSGLSEPITLLLLKYLQTNLFDNNINSSISLFVGITFLKYGLTVFRLQIQRKFLFF